MATEPPDHLAIDHDDHHAEHVGRLSDGRQFFLTTPFVPGIGDEPGCEYVALFLFSADGIFLEARIDTFGPRPTMDDDRRRTVYERRLAELGDVTFGRIVVQPFSLDRDGVTFGLLPREIDDDPGVWSVELHPGNYMAFFEPWDSGIYDT